MRQPTGGVLKGKKFEIFRRITKKMPATETVFSKVVV